MAIICSTCHEYYPNHIKNCDSITELVLQPCNCGKLDMCNNCLACTSNINKYKPYGHFEDCKFLGIPSTPSNQNVEMYKQWKKAIAKDNNSEPDKDVFDKVNEITNKKIAEMLGVPKIVLNNGVKENNMTTSIPLKKCYCYCPECNNNDKCVECNYCTASYHTQFSDSDHQVDCSHHISNKKETAMTLIDCNCGDKDKCSYCGKCTDTTLFSTGHSDDCMFYHNTKPTATFTKLNNGTWAINSLTQLSIGEEVVVKKKDGTTSTEIVEKFYKSLVSKYDGKEHYIYTIKTKYAKGGNSSGLQPKVKSTSKKAKIVDYYEVSIWIRELVYTSNGDGTKQANFNWKLDTHIDKMAKEGVETIKEIYVNKTPSDELVMWAKKIPTYYNKPTYNDILVGNYNLIEEQIELELAKKEAIENKERTWIACTMSCDTFPARSQKIKGLREASSYINNVTANKSINNAVVVTENLDIENVFHYHDSVGYGYSKKKENKRKKLDEILDIVAGNFMRPCPQSPEHGFVDSRLVEDKESVAKVIEEIRATGEIPEFIVMPKIECEYSGVITPDRIGLGRGHDGATSGKDTIGIPLEIGNEHKDAMIKKFWNNNELYCTVCKDVFENNTPDVIDGKCVNCGAKLERKWPFVEVLYSKDIQPVIVQMRSGIELSIESEKIKVRYVKEIHSDMDLIEWGKLSKQLKDDIIIGSNGSYSRECPVVWHPGGDITSHFGVHCKETKLPYITSMEKPVEGSIIEVGVKNPTNIDALREGIVLGMETKIAKPYDSNRTEIKKYLRSFIGCLHLYAIADLGEASVARMIGYNFAIGVRIIAGLPLGEARHNQIARDRLDAMVGQVELLGKGLVKVDGNRDIIYNIAWHLELEKLISCLIDAYNSFKTLKWRSSFGGKAWAGCTLSLLRCFISMKDFIKDKTPEKATEIIDNINIMINMAHNTGWFLNKLLSQSDFDNASILPHFYISPELAYKCRDEYSGIGNYAMKLRGFNMLKRFVTLDENGDSIALDAKALEAKVIEESKPIVKKTQVEIINSIIVESLVKAQYNNGGGLHLQIACQKINRDYGYSNNCSLDKIDSEFVTKWFNEAYSLGYTSNSLTGSQTKYATCNVYKTTNQNVLAVEIADSYIEISDYYLFAQMDAIKGFQETGLVNTSKTTINVEGIEWASETATGISCMVESPNGYYCSLLPNHLGKHIAKNSKGICDGWEKTKGDYIVPILSHQCLADSKDSWSCNLEKNHSGNHVAFVGYEIVDEWHQIKQACNVSSKTNPNGTVYHCSLPQGHEGEHIAQGTSGNVYATWHSEEPIHGEVIFSGSFEVPLPNEFGSMVEELDDDCNEDGVDFDY